LLDVQNLESCRIDTVKQATSDLVEAQLTVAKVKEDNLRGLEKALALVSPTLDILDFIEQNSKLTPDQQLQMADPYRPVQQSENIYFPKHFAKRLGFCPAIESKAWDKLFFGTWLLSQSGDIDLAMTGHLTSVLELGTQEVETYLQLFQPRDTSSVESRLLALLQVEGLESPLKQQVVKDELTLTWEVIAWTTDERLLVNQELPECFHKAKVSIKDIGFALQSLDSNAHLGQPSVWQWPIVQWLSRGVHTALVSKTKGAELLCEPWRQYLDSLGCLWPSSWVSLWLVLTYHTLNSSFEEPFLDLQKVMLYCLANSEGTSTVKVSAREYPVTVFAWTQVMAKQTAFSLKKTLRNCLQSMPVPAVLEALIAANELAHALAVMQIDWREELRLYGLSMASQAQLDTNGSFEEYLSRLSAELERLRSGFAEDIWARRIEHAEVWWMRGVEEGMRRAVSGLLDTRLEKGGKWYLWSEQAKSAAEQLTEFDQAHSTQLSSLMSTSLAVWVNHAAELIDTSNIVLTDSWESLSSALPHSHSARELSLKLSQFLGTCQSNLGRTPWQNQVCAHLLSSKVSSVFNSYSQEMARSLLVSCDIDRLPSYVEALWARSRPAEVLWKVTQEDSLELSKALLRLNNVEYLAQETSRLLRL
jgi:hypothetical protein